MTETVLWQALKRALGPYGILERREDRLDTGVPDVLYALRPRPDAGAAVGQIELKHLPAWPSQPGTPIRLPHHTREQALYARRWWAAGARCWTLARVGPTLLLVPGWAAPALQEGHFSQAGLREVATLVIERGTLVGPLLAALTGPRESNNITPICMA